MVIKSDPLLPYFEALPKVELHLHMEGAIRPETLLRLADRNHLRLPFTNPDQWQQFCIYRNFGDFAKALLTGVRCLQQPEDFFDLIIDIGQHLAEQNILYAEVTWTPQFYINRTQSLEVIFDALNEARRQICSQFGVDIRWIPDLVRSFPDPAWAITKWASQPDVRSAGVVALGLGGPEAGHPASGFAAQFEYARAQGLPANPHTGEGMGAEGIWETIKSLKPTRLGHGVRAIEDQNLVAYLASHAIPLEVCLTSNVMLGVFPSYAEHPVKRLIDAGCAVSLNSDDPILFQTTLAQEYVHAVRRCGLDIQDVKQAILSAIRFSYLPADEKLLMQEKFQREFIAVDSAFSTDLS